MRPTEIWTPLIQNVKQPSKLSRDKLCKYFNIPIQSWEQAAQDQSKWCSLINKGGAHYEEQRIYMYEAVRKRRMRSQRSEHQNMPHYNAVFKIPTSNI